MVKIGDKVRFLNAIGGGIVSRIEGKLVYVEDKDGFEMPTQLSEVIAVGEKDTFIPAYKPPRSRSSAEPKAQENDTKGEYRTPTTATSPLEGSKKSDASSMSYDELFRPKRISSAPVALHDKLNAFLGFLPANRKQLSTTNFEVYLINDSPFALLFTYASQESGALQLRVAGQVGANTKVFLEEIAREDIDSIARLNIDIIPYKTEARYLHKGNFAIDLKVDGIKFFKLHSFRENDFFDEGAIIYPLIQDNKPRHQLTIKPDELAHAMQEKRASQNDVDQDERSRRRTAEKKKEANAIIEIDLHASQILDSTSGMTPTAILEFQLNVFRDTLREHAKEAGRRIVFIHGKGDGVLRRALLDELKRKHPRYAHQDASFREYGFGATMVTIY